MILNAPFPTARVLSTSVARPDALHRWAGSDRHADRASQAGLPRVAGRPPGPWPQGHRLSGPHRGRRPSLQAEGAP